ncbi:MAG: transcription elongation factor GreA [Candidatus Jacksonbacteria bacterium RIFOXYC2_FULL_44_29]|nr:MAG: Transcription elongation factor GreA [Parcubacteria group bacterium GW2011_GWC2_44_22]OGY75735.1 MAG: transcription elongation factor GreA [Candidatus Jacksonbacteria bacterium RIFOXYA2_FULL_43_12]OGY76301.1 MAG: transcription elongation factor GreA [Candidatus Jacksonbacteria bacterium RIFOXYB2_FULL_44_15]OGY78127.1 MAG: transcription elongation factor GreA [Candidatus Jacksonbacteria bacterium RIFOXYC2_FULL_44_29]OGY80964.1 MAG: transcription elongation factor GreA [Candidatus Jackson
MDQKLLTPAGFKKLEAELIKLKIKRSLVVEKIKDAKELGDLSENAEYHAAKEEQGFIEARINEIESLMKVATIVKPTTSKTNVNLGSKIKVKSDVETFEYEIVGMNEADPSAGKISSISPLGEAFLGRKMNDEVTVNVPSGRIKFKILDIK